MKILALGDVVGTAAVDYLTSHLWRERDRLGVDFVVANGENASNIHGISTLDAKAMLSAGVDLLSGGNHIFKKKDIYSFLDSSPDIIRPANFPVACPGSGYALKNVNSWRILCINVLGTVYLEPLDSPFVTVEKILEREKGSYDLSLLDIHAEATSEKLALARYFDGRINVIFGTHTHVQTADEQILPAGTGYITDLGMTGPHSGILGTAAEPVLAKFTTKMPQYFTVAEGDISAHGALFEVDPSSGKVKNVTRVVF